MCPLIFLSWTLNVVREILSGENFPKTLVRTQWVLLRDLGDGYGEDNVIDQASKGTRGATQVQATMEV